MILTKKGKREEKGRKASPSFPFPLLPFPSFDILPHILILWKLWWPPPPLPEGGGHSPETPSSRRRVTVTRHPIVAQCFKNVEPIILIERIVIQNRESSRVFSTEVIVDTNRPTHLIICDSRNIISFYFIRDDKKVFKGPLFIRLFNCRMIQQQTTVTPT